MNFFKEYGLQLVSSLCLVGISTTMFISSRNSGSDQQTVDLDVQQNVFRECMAKVSLDENSEVRQQGVTHCRDVAHSLATISYRR